MEINIEIFELKYLQFILSNFWYFLGVIILILTIRGDTTEGIKSIKSWVARKKVEITERIKNEVPHKKVMPDFLRKLKREREAKQKVTLEDVE